MLMAGWDMRGITSHLKGVVVYLCHQIGSRKESVELWTHYRCNYYAYHVVIMHVIYGDN